MFLGNYHHAMDGCKVCVTLFCFLEIMSCILGVWGTCGVIWDVEFLVQVCVFASGFRWVGWLVLDVYSTLYKKFR